MKAFRKSPKTDEINNAVQANSEEPPQTWVDLPSRSSPLMPRSILKMDAPSTPPLEVPFVASPPPIEYQGTEFPMQESHKGRRPVSPTQDMARSMAISKQNIDQKLESFSDRHNSLYSPRSPRQSLIVSRPITPSFSIERRRMSNESFVSARTQKETKDRDQNSFDVGKWTVTNQPSENALTLVTSEPIRGPEQFPQTIPPYGGFQIEDHHEMLEAVRQIGTFLEDRRKSGLRASKAKPLRFWLAFTGIAINGFLSCVDMTIIAPILPTIAEDLPPSEISATWITAAFLVTMASFQPFWGGFSDAFGRRCALVTALLIFLLGSIPCVVAKSMLVLVVGRGIKGVGGGGMLAVGEVMISDMTTLAERGYFLGLLSFAFAAASIAAPLVGGVFANAGGLGWRWAFLINFPIGLLALAFILTTQLNTPKLSNREKFARTDLPASIVLFGSTLALLIGLTRGGTSYLWSEASVAVPLAFGAAGLLAYFALQWIPNRLTPRPILDRHMFCSSRTAFIAYLLTFLHGIILYGAVQSLILYFENRDATPLRAAVNVLPANAPSTPAAFVAGVTMGITGRYKTLIIISQLCMTIGFGMFIYLDTTSPTYQWVIFQVIASFGVGSMYTLALPPIQASVSAKYLARATASFAFLRSLGAVWGVSSTLIAFSSTSGQKLQGVPGAAAAGVTGANAISTTTLVKYLPLDIREGVRLALGHGIQIAFVVLLPFAVIGLTLSLFIVHIPLPNFNDSEFGLQEQEKSKGYDVEKQSNENGAQTRSPSASDNASMFKTPHNGVHMAIPPRAATHGSLSRSSSFWR